MAGTSSEAFYPVITVREFLGLIPKAKFELLAGEEGLDRKINRPRVQKLGLILAGFPKFIHQERVHLVGNTEIEYLMSLPEKDRTKALMPVFERKISCLVITKGLVPPEELVALARVTKTPLLRSPLRTTFVIQNIAEGLQDILAPTISCHGVLVDVFGIGTLLRGESSIGKSETALDLIVRKHRLVADDIVEIRKKSDVLIGRAPEAGAGYMELRGLGIINIKDLFGIVAVRNEKIIDLIVDLKTWKPGDDIDRLGDTERNENLLGVDVPAIEMPVASGRNISIILEVAASNLLLKRQGIYSAQEFIQKQKERFQNNRQ
ncbi:MAG TPA: HPr(Ser) kinase/phosphatase [Acidobacteriota bacterium]|nr:HPr(Ser) kinase/phosphatase [Acidobacteriota bacterium]HNT18332.1 HPr(Ser) kinase/phosphatase [Acidobacteriota bacterium]HPA27123.1 HPr(Ser) kinase/phosphatase [Acidobacteriota bacterium]HQO20582.1 HPr(Ser) kinase/phosphatase [Acidobacteriota bacterium]